MSHRIFDFGTIEAELHSNPEIGLMDLVIAAQRGEIGLRLRAMSPGVGASTGAAKVKLTFEVEVDLSSPLAQPSPHGSLMAVSAGAARPDRGGRSRYFRSSDLRKPV